MRRLRALALATMLCVAPAERADAADVSDVRGAIQADTHWKGVVRVTGDVLVQSGATLTIEPGTRVLIAAKAQTKGQWNDALVELHVRGSLIADGNQDAPIEFLPEAWQDKPPEKRPRADGMPWLGIVLHPEAAPAPRLRWCVLRGALMALQVGARNVHVRDCTFERCTEGVGAGHLYASADMRAARLRSSAPQLRRCRFYDCSVGVGVESEGRPEVRRSLFLACDYGIGNRRAGLTWPITGVGPYVDRCLFVRCRKGMHGPTRVANSIFLDNEVALAASTFQHRYGVVSDHTLRSHNLFWNNVRLSEGDTELGDGALFERPGFVRPVNAETPVAEILGRLSGGFLFRPQAAASRAATDGGGLGPGGQVGTRRALERKQAVQPGLAIDRWLVLGPPGGDAHDLSEKSVREVCAKKPKAGSSWNSKHWGVLSLDARSRSRLLRSGAGSESGIAAIAYVKAERETRARLLVGCDGALKGWLNGTPLNLAPQRRRYQAADQAIPVLLHKGVNVLLLVWSEVDASSRIAVSLTAPAAAASAPIGVDVAHGAYSSRRRKDGPLQILTAVGRRIRSKGQPHWALTIRLDHRLHWVDVLNPAALVEVRSAAGVVLPMRDVTVRYKPATRSLRLEGLGIKADVDYTVRLLGGRRPSGEAYALAADPAPVVLK